MNDRTPLSQVVDKEEPTPVFDDSNVRTPITRGIDEMKDLSALSMLLGFEEGFGGDGKWAETIYQWAKDNTQKTGGPETVLLVKELIKDRGFSGTKKNLLHKIYKWIQLDSGVLDIRKRQEAL